MKQFITAILMLATTSAQAGEVEIIDVIAAEKSNGWRFAVTLKHGDTGKEHYADLWQIEAPDGTVLHKRVLGHPHVEEQPFTRSLHKLDIPKELNVVYIRARDSKHGFSDKLFKVELNR